MTTNRRDFLKTSALLGGALGAGLTSGASTALGSPRPPLDAALPDRPVERAAKPLKILILGGTGFIGPHEVRYAVARGHTVTLFNRGKTNPGLFPNLEKLEGDRAVNNYESLKKRDWDVVIDNPSTLPRWVRQATDVLKGHAKQYVFVSTISVYAKNDTPGADETADVLTTTEPDAEDARRLYGPLKALSEKEAEKAFPGHATVIRPGLIVGPGDLSDRFTYWPVRLDKGGEVLAPGTPLDPVQIIDARDLAEFVVRACEDGYLGTYNCTGPRSRLTMGEMLGAIRGVTASDAWLTWLDSDFLDAQQIRAWSDMPVWVPPKGEYAGFAARSIARALAKGLTFRPLAVTAKDTLDFYNGEPEDRKAHLRAGLAAEKEKAALELWHSKKP